MDSLRDDLIRALQAGVKVPILTVLQPYASALVAGPKPGENRVWRPKELPDKGMLLIHSAARMYPNVTRKDFALPRPGAGGKAMWPECPSFDALPMGGIIGGVHISGFEYLADAEDSDDPWLCGPWVWRVSDRCPLSAPVACTGFQKLWKASPKTYADVLFGLRSQVFSR